MDLSIYTNDLSAIHTVLKRLNEAGEIRLIPRASGKNAYLWQAPTTAIAIGPEVAQYIRESGHVPHEPRHSRKTEKEMSDLQAQRRFFAEEIQITSNLKSPAVVEALASVAARAVSAAGSVDDSRRSRLQGAAAQDRGRRSAARVSQHRGRHRSGSHAVQRRARLVAMAIDALALKPGDRVLHLGTGLGYYTALIAACVGPQGRVLGIEVDPDLAAAARRNLADRPWVEMRHGDGAGPLDETFDAILINAGVTHPLPAWLDALAPDGRMIVPLTATTPAMTTIGKGPLRPHHEHRQSRAVWREVRGVRGDLFGRRTPERGDQRPPGAGDGEVDVRSHQDAAPRRTHTR